MSARCEVPVHKQAHIITFAAGNWKKFLTNRVNTFRGKNCMRVTTWAISLRENPNAFVWQKAEQEKNRQDVIASKILMETNCTKNLIVWYDRRTKNTINTIRSKNDTIEERSKNRMIEDTIEEQKMKQKIEHIQKHLFFKLAKNYCSLTRYFMPMNSSSGLQKRKKLGKVWTLEIQLFDFFFSKQISCSINWWPFANNCLKWCLFCWSSKKGYSQVTLKNSPLGPTIYNRRLDEFNNIG